MAWRHHGCYSPDPYRGRAHGSCDRCTRQFLLSELKYQYEFRGNALTNTLFRVCCECMDVPYQGNRPIKLPADPVPVDDPRVEPFLAEENAGSSQATGTGYYITETGAFPYSTEDGAKIYVPE